MGEPRENPIAVIVNTIKHEEMQTVLRNSISKLVPLEKFTAAAVGAIRSNPQVFADCERNSIYNSLIDAARRGLIPDGKQGALVPFNTKIGDQYVKKCQFMIMPQGIIDSLAAKGITVYAQSVYKNDDYEFWSDDKGQHVRFGYEPFGDRGERIGAFACAQAKDGTSFVEAVNMEYIQRVMAVSKQKDRNGNPTGPWKDWREGMEQKTALHKICKRLPTVEIGDDDEYKDEPAVAVAAGDAVSPPPGKVPAIERNKEGAPSEAKRPKALQAVIDSDTGEILNAEAVRESEGLVEQNPEGAPF